MTSETEKREASPGQNFGVVFDGPTVADGREMHRIVVESGVLDENSPYAYLLVSTHFGATSVVARDQDRLVGFVAGYRPPSDPETAFVWQIAVDPSVRRQGLGSKLLAAFAMRPGNLSARFVTATVTPGNTASRRLFQSFAKSLGVPYEWSAGFAGSDFGTGGHEPEELIRIGPLEK